MTMPRYLPHTCAAYPCPYCHPGIFPQSKPEVAMDNIGKIRNTVSLELARAFKVSDLQARSEMCSELIQCLATGLALAITQGCGGHPQGVSDMLDGTTNFIHEEAARYMPLAQAMARPGNT